MTVERTKQILGNKISHLSDEQILHFIQATDEMLDVLMRSAIKQNPVKEKPLVEEKTTVKLSKFDIK